MVIWKIAYKLSKAFNKNVYNQVQENCDEMKSKSVVEDFDCIVKLVVELSDCYNVLSIDAELYKFQDFIQLSKSFS